MENTSPESTDPRQALKEAVASYRQYLRHHPVLYKRLREAATTAARAGMAVEDIAKEAMGVVSADEVRRWLVRFTK